MHGLDGVVWVYEVMGSMWKRWFERRILTNVVMLGLDAAGKTAVLYKLRLGTVGAQSIYYCQPVFDEFSYLHVWFQTPQTIPTMGFNTEVRGE
eukprot:173495-Amorphochlora_amoeboformis.AAC.1